MNLNTRFVLLRVAILLVFSLLSWLAFDALLNEINLQWGTQLAERQVLFDKHRTLAPLIREIKLARQMASNPALIEMALHDEDPAAKSRGLKMLEQYRFNFRDHSYFAAFAHSGNYYYNDTTDKYSADPYRYTLSPGEKNDQWFYATIKSGMDYQINIDPDTHLDTVKVWINVLIKHEGKVIGVTGTGIDLSEFLQESMGINQPGIENFFVDKSLAIQLSTDKKLIDYASIAKDVNDRLKIDVLFKDPEDIAKLRRAIKSITTQPEGEIATLWVNYRGEKHLLGLAYLPEIAWYDLTLMDEKSLTLLHDFKLLAGAVGLLFLIALLVLDFFLRRWVLNPIRELQLATEEIEHGHYDFDPPQVGTGEIAQLSDSFRKMVAFVRQNNHELENKVKERTEDLHRQTETDPLTGLLNRRGMMSRFEQENARLTRQGGSMGLLLLDLDHFKQVNDNYGHTTGDLALCATANILLTMKRNYDHAARWGGEEFLLLLPECSEQDISNIAERIRAAIESLRIETGKQPLSFTVSIGTHHVRTTQTLDAMLQQVDKALYAAKDAGRNCIKQSKTV